MSEVRVPMNTRKEAVINRILSATRQNDQCQQQQKQQRVPLKPQPPLLPALGSALGNSQSKSQQGPRPVMFFGIHRFQEAQTLVKKLRSSNERERSAASKALLKYCRSITKLHTRYCQSQVGLEWQIAAGSFGVVEMAVELIGSDDPEVQLQAIKVLGTLVVGRPANQSIAGSMGAVKMLLQAVQSRDQELQMQSAAALGKMSSGCETNQSEAAALGAITVFLKLAQTEDAVLQKRALLTLEGLVQGHEVNQCEMIRAGAIPALQRIIQSAEAEVDTRKQASATLGRIYNQEDVAYNKSKAHALLEFCKSEQAIGQEWQDEAREAGFVNAIINITDCGDAPMQIQAIQVLRDLVSGHECNKAAAGQAGAIALLLRLSQSPNVELQLEALKTLEYLVNNCSPNQLKAASAGGVEMMMELARSADASTQIQALSTLGAIVDGNDGNKSAAGDAGAVDVVLQLTRSADATLQQAAMKILKRLVLHHSSNKLKAASAGGVEMMMELARSADASTQIQALSTLGAIVEDHDGNKSVAGQAGAIKLLFELTKSKDSKIYRKSVKTLELLLSNHSSNMTMMMELARSADASTQIQALSTLGAIVDGNDGNKSAAGDAGAVDVVLQLTRSADATLQQAAMKTLKRLVLHHSSNKLKAASAGGVEMMMELARSADASTQIQALSTLGAIVHLIHESQSLILVDALALCTTLFTAKNAEIQWASLDFLDDVLANHESNRSLAGCDGALSSILPLIFAKDAQSSKKLTRVKTKAMELLVRLVRCHADNQSEAGRLGIVDLCVQHALATSDQVEHKWYIYCLESLVRGHHVNQSSAVEAGAVSLCLSHVQGGCLKFEAGYKAAMQAAALAERENKLRRDDNPILDEVARLLVLVQQLKSNESAMIISAIREMGDFVIGNSRRQSAAGEVGAVQLMVRLAESSHQEVQLQAVKCLRCLVDNHPANQAAADQSDVEGVDNMAAQPAAADAESNKEACLRSFFDFDDTDLMALDLLSFFFQHSNKSREAISMQALECLVYACNCGVHENRLMELLEKLSATNAEVQSTGSNLADVICSEFRKLSEYFNAKFEASTDLAANSSTATRHTVPSAAQAAAVAFTAEAISAGALDTLKTVFRSLEIKTCDRNITELLDKLFVAIEVVKSEQKDACSLAAMVDHIRDSHSQVLLDALPLCTKLFTSKNPEVQLASLEMLRSIVGHYALRDCIRSSPALGAMLSLMQGLLLSKDESWLSSKIRAAALRVVQELVHCHVDGQSEAGRLGIVDLCVQHALATSDQVEHKWYIYCLESLVRGHHVNQSLAVEAGAVSLCLSHVQGGCLKFEAGYKAAMQAAGGLNLTYFIVLLEVTRAGKMQPGQIEALRRVALHENNDALLQFIDFSDNGTIERLCNSSSALISRMLQSALPPNPLLRANRNANPLHAAPTASQWARGMYAPASRLNHFVTLYFSTTLEVLPMSTAQRQLLLPLCGMLQKLAHRLAHSTHSPNNAVSGNRSQATLLTKTLGITLVYRFLKTRFLQRINAAPVLEQRVADERATAATVTASAAS